MNPLLRHAIPNGLSALRLVLGCAFPFIPADWRVAVVVVAALSDMFDGLAARWLRAESDTGRLLDPVADKVFVMALAGTLIAEGALDPWWALGLALRDVVVLVGLFYTIAGRQWARGRKMRPSWLGKCTTAAQFVVLFWLVGWPPVPVWFLAPTVLLSAAAAMDYAGRFAVLQRSEGSSRGNELPGEAAKPAS